MNKKNPRPLKIKRGPLKEVVDLWDKWPVKSQIYRYTQILAKEEDIVQQAQMDSGSNSDDEEFQARFLFQTEGERNEFIKEMLVDLKFKVLFFLHVLIEAQDKEAIMFALKELLQKGFVQEEIDKIDDDALQQIQKFFQEKHG